MTQLYFHCARTDGTLRNGWRADVVDLVEACERATRFVRKLIAAPSLEDWRKWVLRVSDDDGRELFTLPFSSLLGKPN